ncbi:ProQ/FINO family protein [Halomonas sp. RA08-2]|uniref:ProQ/FINO family protein n=1 Tax=Halomonas sp. RA08-2 TaxID=3440842 RepID=UPI003EE9DBC5
MTEERSIRLLDALEGRTDTLLGLIRQERESRLALQQRLAELEAARLTLAEKARELEANRLELVEENRELDEQNRELEEHNRHLHDRLAKGPGENTFPRPARRSQGLSALMGRRAAPSPDASRKTLEASRPETPAPAAATPVEGPAAEDQAAKEQAAPAGVSLAEGATSRRDMDNALPPGSSPSIASTSTASTSRAPTSLERTEERRKDAESTEASGAQAPDQQDALTIGEAPSPQALLTEWYRRYPGAFFKGHTRPLKVGIHEELAQREPWPEKLVRRALACYVNLPRYLKAVREGAERIDLEGHPAGGVDAKAAEHARKKLDRLQAERRGKARPDTPGRENSRGNSRENSRGKAGLKRTGPGVQPEAKPELGRSSETPLVKGESATPSSLESKAAKPRPAGEARFVTMEEKLAALVAKHRQP